MNTTRAAIASHIRQAQTPAEELRYVLGRLEAEIGKLGYPGQDRPVEVLTMLDRASELLETITQHGGDLAAERGRFDTITQQFRRKGGAFVRQIGGAEALRDLRAEQKPPEVHWWWYTDERLASERKAQLRKTLRTMGILAVVIAALSGLYALFLQPDKATRERALHEQRAETALAQGDLPLALSQTEQALTYAPQDPNLEVTRGAVLELMGRQDEAGQVFAQTRLAFESDPNAGGLEAFYSARAQVYLMAGAADRALADTQAMVSLNPDSAMGYFQMGNVNATLGNVVEASQEYQKAGELASASGQIQLEAMARIQLANLTLMLSGPQIGTPTPTP